jgi:glucan biosynthesis protein
MAELQVMDIYHRWTGQESEPVQIDYPDNFEIETISQALANSKLVREIFGDKSPTFTSEHLRRMARRLTPKLEEGLAETIAEELEESATSDAQALAFDEEMQYLTNPSEPMDAV